MIYTQKDIYDYLCENPLEMPVYVGDAPDMNGKDYIFVDYLESSILPSDNRGVYRTRMEIIILTRDMDDRFVLARYITDYLNCRITYMKSEESEYFMARCETTVLLHG